MKKWIGFAALVALSACSSSPTRGTASETASAVVGDYTGPIIDAHMHFEGEETGPSETMLAEMKKNNIRGAVVHASQRKAIPDIQTAASPKFAVCAAAVPGKKIGDIQKGLDEKRYHCIKIYLGYVPKAATDPFYKPFYRLAEKRNVPVVFHTGDTLDKMASIKYADPMGVDEVAITYPKVKFVIAHMGNPWFHTAAEVVYKNDNVYVDMSALMMGDLSKTAPEALQELIIKPVRWFFLYVENPKKFLFGTDYPLITIAPYLNVIKRAIPQEHWQAVLHDNAVAVFPTLK